MGIKITSPGMLTTIQDLGRFGYMAHGFSPSGAMDADSLIIANKIVGNNDSEGALEMTVTGISCTFLKDCVIAVTGADMGFKLGGKPLERYAPVEIRQGDCLSGSAAKTGVRAYLSVAGGFDTEPVMGSYSTNLKCALGGFHGRKLVSGDVLPLRYERDSLLAVYKAHEITQPVFPDVSAELRVVLGPQNDAFTNEGIKAFLSEEYTVTNESDRMGIRLSGKKIEAKNGVDIISDGIALGSVQIPSSGTPIIMAADRQTTGGYAKIATVISCDMAILAQAKPGTKIRFSAVSPGEARQIVKKHRRELAMLDYRLMF